MKTITKEIIENTRESIVVEYKTAEGNLPSDFWETYSAFCNTEGGVIILGVKEAKPKNIIKGVNNPDQIQRDLWNLLSNRNKVSYNALSNDVRKLEKLTDTLELYLERNERGRTITGGNDTLS